MKLIKKQETEIWQVYNTWLHAYLNGDIATYDKYLDKDYHFIGSTDNEEFLSKKDTTNFFEKTADQLAGKCDLRNETKIIEKFGELVFITHLFDAWFINGDDWAFYGRFRFTNALQKNKEGWRFIYQHFSTTDSKTDEGETIGFDKVNAENLELKDAIKRRTFELEAKNRELEIETSLEKVRTIAMGMKESKDMLEVCKTISQQLQVLGVKQIRNVQTAIFYESRGTYMNYEYYAKQQKIIITDTSYTNNKLHKSFANQMLKGKDEFFTSHIKGKKVKEWLAYQKTTNVFIDKYLNTATSLNYYWDSLGPVALGISTYVPLNEEDLDLFKRFRNVFELAYTRYLDIEQALAQAREAQVEASLERVRALAMAMKSSSDLLDIVVYMRKEFIKLGHEAHYFWHMMWLPKIYEKAMTSGDGTKIGFVMKLPRHIHGDIPLLAKWEKSKKQTVVYTMNVEEALDYVHKMVTLGDFQNIDPQAPTEDDIRHIGGLTFIMARTTHGEIGYSLPGIVKNPPKEDIDILVKFAGAFDLAHRRFLDLQNAEKQAREVEIELALEKVRSRSLAMHKSEELNEVVSVIFEKLKDLQIPATAVGIGIYIDGSKDLNSYVCGENKDGLVITNYRLPYFNNKISREICNLHEKQLDFFVGHYTKAVKNSFYKYILEHTPEFKHLPEDIKSMIFNSPSYTITMVGVNHAIFNINDFEGKVLSDNDITIIKRFAKVFDQAYTRFLDLQKAEAQARESEIELALERVRARTMAMQHSDELAEASFLLDQQVRALGIKTWGCAFNIYRENKSTEWFGNEAGVLHTYTVPRAGIFKDYYDKGQKGETLFIQEFSGKACVAHYEYMSSLPVIGEVLKNLKKTNKGFPTYQIDHVVYFKYGYLLFITKEHVPEAHDIFKRFAKVFEQTYTRFLDLKKAEAQARESEIELALERVRARTMAMQKSQELAETSYLLFEQFKNLGETSEQISIGIFKDEKNLMELYSTLNGKQWKEVIHIDLGEPVVMKKIRSTWKKKNKSLVLDLQGNDLEKYNAYRKTLSKLDYKEKRWIIHSAFFSKGVLTFSSTKPHSNETIELLERFAKVFEQTYTRFLDLQKAEKQTREVQIQLALERVRARTMAMQHSDELVETSELLFQQIKDLGVELWSCGYSLWYDDDSYFIGYNPMPDGKMGPKFKIPLTEDTFFKTIRKAKRKGEEFLVFESKGKSLVKTYEYMDGLPVVGEGMRAIVNKGYDLPTFQVTHCGFFTQGHLMFITHQHYPEAHDIFKRFTKEFEQTYTRFQDLQKAEAQAKEAQIEAALERVRSRSMAMHNSEELKEVIQVLYDQFVQLGIPIEHAGFILDYKENDDMHIWLADHNAVFPKIVLPYFDCAHWNSFNKAKKKRQNFFTNQLGFEEKNKFYKDLFEFIPDLPEETKTTYFKFDGLAISTVLLDSIGLYIENYSGTPFSDDENNILMRFGKVFQQTYTRFLDLQKAEAQAKEAQIEAALERVRSRSMAMHNSDELREAGALLFNEITKLGIESITSGYVILEEDEKIGWNYMPDPSTGQIIPIAIGVFHDKTDNMRSVIKNWKKQEPVFVIDMDEQQTIDHQTFIAEQSINFPISAEKLIAVSPAQLKLHNFNFKQGYLLIVGGEFLTDNQTEIMLRFTKVFQQTYTRFLDLQKAEAQAREVRIEMALEKVRSRTMAMQHSKELPEAANVLFSEVQNLGIPAWSCGYNILSEDKKSSTCIMSSEGEIQSPFVLPLTKHKSLKPWHKAILNNEDFFVYEQGRKDLKEHYDYMQSLPDLKETFQQLKEANIPLPTFQVNHLAKFTNGFLLFITYERVPEAHDIFQRFAKVFEQTYTRFLDLEKAEAQTRKAQIEASLERVRARAMAMHDSNELDEVLSVLCEQFDVLGILPMSTHMTVLDVENNTFTFRETGKFGNRSFGEQTVALDAMDNWKENVENWRANEATAINKLHFPKEQLPKVWEVFHESFASMPEGSRITPKDYPDGIYHTSGKHPFGYIGMNQVRPATEEEEQIIIKFANEFGRAFQRFLDLQKAEAQTREAQINLSVERVRAKALAMHKSEEIIEVVAKLKDEVMALDIPDVIAATIFLKEGEDKVRMWDLSSLDITDNNDYEVPFDITFIIKKTDPHLYMKRVWENTDDYFVEIQEGKDFKRLMEWLREHHKDDIAIEVEEFMQSTQLKRLYHAAKKLNNGKLVIDLLDPPSDEMETILTKMGAAFDLAYKRFEDLQKAEAQTREAQIEAALEKVRSHSLAMHNADELGDVVLVIVEKLTELGVILDANGITLCTYFPDSKDVLHWIASPDFSHVGEYLLPYFDHVILNEAWQSKDQGDTYFSKAYAVKDKNSFFEHAFVHSDYKQLPEEFKQWIFQNDKHILSFAWQKNSALLIPSNTGVLPTEDEKEILIRFSKVFEQAYIRFMDLQKAEAQAREAQIEVALERVRARAMAMHQTDELTDVLCVLFDQFDFLGINPVLTHLTLMDEENETFSLRITTTAENRIVAEQFIDINAVDAWKDSFANWKKSEPNAIDCIDYPPEALPMVWEVLGEVMDALPKGHKIYPKDFPDGLFTTQGHFKFGYIGFNHKRRATDEEKSIVVRFAKEFGRTYQRFLDLQKAEAQAKEAQIEAALERVRSRSMAMHKSDEMQLVADTIYEQLHELGFEMHAVGMSGAMNPKKGYEVWAGGVGFEKPLKIPYSEATKVQRDYNDVLIKRIELFSKTYSGKTKKEYIDFLLSSNKFPSFLEKLMVESKAFSTTLVTTKNSGIQILRYTAQSYSEDENTILIRFAKVFEQAYIRFMDLEKAEAQAKEAQIEAALERVRSRSMAMHKSDEMLEVIEVVAKQLLQLNLKFDTISFSKNNQKGEFKFWTASKGQPKPLLFQVPFLNTRMLNSVQEAQKKGVNFIEDVFTALENKEWSQHLIKFSELKYLPQLAKDFMLNAPGFARSSFLLKSIDLYVGNFRAIPFTKEENAIFSRFAHVFEQAYTRFLDLQKSEKQARESLIEASLERVRSRTLAMQNSEELAETSVVVFQQLLELGIAPNRLFIGIIKDEGHKIDAWATNEDGSKLASHFVMQASENKSIKKMLDGWKQKKKSLIIDLKGKELQEYFQYLNKDMEIPFIHGLEQKRRVQTIAYFSGGLIGMAAPEEQPQETIDLLERFAAVFNLTYTRFNDLKVAEAQAREAKIEGALERVRARALAMQEPEELKDVAKVLRHEMGLLDIEELETCSIYINQEATNKTECWYALKDIRSKKQKLINDHFELNLKDTWVGREMQKFYKSKNKEVSIVMTGNNRKEWIDYCEKHSKPFKGYYGEEIPDRTYHLYKFSHGAIGVATSGDISDENWNLIKRTASVFSLAYSRFKDLTQARLDLAKLKEEKQRAEDALSELQTTQTQLIQSEKMASLGELTAGIAHEIQNPLNFVNNFSEVSKELLDEMLEEMENGDLEEVRAIMDDVIQNLEKINHHGKRADGIVKGMLQHSRKSSDTKEPTNINVLADEYLRLAYHGLRAKDKSFNATLVTDFDDTIGSINVLPQDIGRVVLNLLTNAFYVVNEKKQSNQNGYEPTVSLTTKKDGNWVTISVKDNGNGIPKHVLEKIFQPFFTTKPTGQGTGLGLSMSYDIVTKGHGGELKVDTKHGEGTEFSIILPIKSN